MFCFLYISFCLVVGDHFCMFCFVSKTMCSGTEVLGCFKNLLNWVLDTFWSKNLVPVVIFLLLLDAQDRTCLQWLPRDLLLFPTEIKGHIVSLVVCSVPVVFSTRHTSQNESRMNTKVLLCPYFNTSKKYLALILWRNSIFGCLGF